MAAAALPAAASAASSLKDTAKGLVEGLSAAMKEPVFRFVWEPDRSGRKLHLVRSEVNITTGLVVGGVALAMIYEAAQWFANGLSKNGQGAAIGIAEAIDPVPFVVYSILQAAWQNLSLADQAANPLPAPPAGPKTVMQMVQLRAVGILDPGFGLVAAASGRYLSPGALTNQAVPPGSSSEDAARLWATIYQNQLSLWDTLKGLAPR